MILTRKKKDCVHSVFCIQFLIFIETSDSIAMDDTYVYNLSSENKRKVLQFVLCNTLLKNKCHARTDSSPANSNNRCHDKK